MRQIVKLLHRFRQDEGGAFALVFAVIAITLIAMGGAAVDFTSIEQARTRTQAALDAAALALQPSIYSATTGTIQSDAQALLVSQLADGATTWANCATNNNKAPCVTVTTPVFDTTNGQLTLTANLNVEMNFVSLVGVQSMPAQIVSVATRKKLNLEVAMVLDNSGSMGTSFGSGTRLTVLKASAICAANILFYGGGSVKPTDCTQLVGSPTANANVKMALVPFNDEVNIGSGNAGQTWLDVKGGAGTYDNDNLDDDDYTPTPYASTTNNRLTLFTKIKDKNNNPLSWGGCVEARVNNGSTEQYDTDDTTPDTTQPDTMFVPLFAPDNPDTPTNGYSNNYISDTPAVCNWSGSCSTTDTAVATTNTVTTTTVTTVTVKKNGVTTSGPTTTTTTAGPTPTTTTVTTNNSTFTATFGTQQSGSNICTCPNDKVAGTVTNTGPTTVTQVTGPTTTTTGNNTKTTTTTTVTTKTVTTGKTTPSTAVCSGQTYTPIGLSARVLQERLCKYTGSKLTKSVSIGFGPNADCPASAVQPLTNTPSTLTTAINSMAAAGNTNIQEGSAWGFRVLSPTPPFTEANPYDNATSKVMIVMTDGENTYSTTSDMNGATLYAAYAYPWDNYKDTNPKVSRGRMGDVGWTDAQFETQINTRLATTCTNAKKAGITIYTIGLATSATSDPTGNKALLTNCASIPANAYFPTTATDLTQAFTDIANQLAALRLAK